MQVFIVWSSDRTHLLADALASWLKGVVEGLDVFVSSTIDKGVAWPPAIRRALRDSGAGIVCLAWERRDSPWLAFEAGALAGTVHFDEGRLHPYLLNLDVGDVPGPLQQFQATRATREETRTMVASIAGQHGDPGRWADRFESAWPDLAQVLEQLRWMDLEAAVPGFSRMFERNTFRTMMPTGTYERLHRYLVVDRAHERVEAGLVAVRSHCAPDVHEHYVGVRDALVELRTYTRALVAEQRPVSPGSEVTMDIVEHYRRKILDHLEALDVRSGREGWGP